MKNWVLSSASDTSFFSLWFLNPYCLHRWFKLKSSSCLSWTTLFISFSSALRVSISTFSLTLFFSSGFFRDIFYYFSELLFILIIINFNLSNDILCLWLAKKKHNHERMVERTSPLHNIFFHTLTLYALTNWL